MAKFIAILFLGGCLSGCTATGKATLDWQPSETGTDQTVSAFSIGEDGKCLKHTLNTGHLNLHAEVSAGLDQRLVDFFIELFFGKQEETEPTFTVEPVTGGDP